MRRGTFCTLLFALSYVYTATAQAPDEHVLDDSYKFITRPDIEAPRWNVTVYEPDLVSPGYWFVETYDYLDQWRSKGGLWNAPHIFDANGELVWSGSYLSQKYDSFDFRISNVLGKDMLTWLYPHDQSALVLDNHFNIAKKFPTVERMYEHDNMHELQFVDSGTRALYFFDKWGSLSKERSSALGFDGACRIQDNGFREYDLTNNSIVFEWLASDHLDIGESTFEDRNVDWRCRAGWDFLHANSLDKFADGSYLLSARYTDALYKIAPNGSIVWRLGGVKSDFQADFTFSRQHHARILEQNETHTVISVFDNASAEDRLDHDAPYSRGLVFAIQPNEQPMKATLIAEYPHPHGPRNYVLGRGNTQVLPNGNVFNCWVESCLHSEHAPDGRVIMEAQVKQEWLKSYRSYKFEFVGLPHDPPDVHSITEVDGEQVNTTIHVSWNGATEVAAWQFYKTDECGTHKKLLSTVPRKHFETMLEDEGYSKYIMVEALDRRGNSLGRSNITLTLTPTTLANATIEAEEEWWKHDNPLTAWLAEAEGLVQNPVAIGVFWLLCLGGLLALARLSRSPNRSHQQWWKRVTAKTLGYDSQYSRVHGDDPFSLEEGFEDDSESVQGVSKLQ